MKRALVFSLLLMASCAQAADESNAASGLLQTVLGLAIVLALIAGCAWGAKRLGAVRQHGNAAVRVLGGASVGPRERVMLVEVAGQWLVVGVAPGNVNLLTSLPPQSMPPMPAADTLAPTFSDWLKKALAARKVVR